MQKVIAWTTGTGNITLTYTGQGNDTVDVSSDANNLSTSRSQTITVKTTDNSITRQVTVVQAAAVIRNDNYLNFTALEASTISMTSTLTTQPTLSYSKDLQTWVTFDANTTVSLNTGDLVYFKGSNTSLGTASSRYTKFVMTGTIEAHGNIMSLLYGDNADGQLTIPANYCFYRLFYQCPSLVTAPKLPATTLKQRCYMSLFDETSITIPPVLPATTMQTYCYCYMFRRTPLSTCPELPATTLADRCYANMFSYCENIKTPPILPATTLVQYCYTGMFNYSGLTSAPELPATTLQTGCYSAMFGHCTSLTTAPVLPATTLVSQCYTQMFDGCTNLNYIKAMFTTTPKTTYSNNWVREVAASGTFVKNSAAAWTDVGVYAVPSGWTVQTASS